MESLILSVLVGSLVLCLVFAYAIAADKGHDPLGYTTLALFLQPIGVIVVLPIPHSVEIRMRKQENNQRRPRR